MQSPRSIPELLEAADSSDLAVAGHACRELLNRHAECHEHVHRLFGLLRNKNAAIEGYAYLILERVGKPAVDPLTATFERSEGEFRRLLMGLIASIGSFGDYFPLLRIEIKHGEIEDRYWAANCLGRKYDAAVDWPPDAIDLLGEAIDILVSLQNQPVHWAQARMTLKHLGNLPDRAL